MTINKYYEDQHVAELKRKVELSSALTMPVGVVVIVVGGVAYLAKEIKFPLTCFEALLLLALILSFVACLFSSYFLFRSLNGYTYRFPATTLQIRSYIEELQAYHLACGKSDEEAKQIAETETLEYLSGEHAKYADVNAGNNDRKSAFLHLGNRAMFAAVLFLFVAGFFRIANHIFIAYRF